MIIPIGHEEDEVRRWPWVTIVFGVACLILFAYSNQAEKRAQEITDAKASEVIEYFFEHPHLELDEELEKSGNVEFFLIGRYLSELNEGELEVPEPSLYAKEREQEELDELTAAWKDARFEIPAVRWGLVPADWQLGDLIAYMFMHAGWMHLLGNLFLLWLAGPPLEDVWGRPFFAAFYLATGVIGGLLWIGRYAGSGVPLIGASGAIAGLMGAFMVRYWTSKINFFYFIWFFRIFVGTFRAPAWLMLGLWFAGEYLSAQAMEPIMAAFGGGGVAYWVHVWGFAFGVGVALVMRRMKVEERVLRPQIDKKLGEEENTAVEEAHDLRQQGRVEEAWQRLLAELRQNPGNVDASLALWDVALATERTAEAAPVFLRLIRQEMRQGELQLGMFHWLELVENVPDVKLDLDLRIRLAEACLEETRDDDAAELLASVHEGIDPELPMGVLVRLARVAARSLSASTEALCGLVLARPDVPDPVREELGELLVRAKARGLRSAAAGEPQTPADDDAPLPLSEVAPAHRTLKVMAAVPRQLTGPKITVDLQGQARVLPLDRIQAVAVAKIDEGFDAAYVVIDLLVDSLWDDRPQVRTVRLRSDQFDARTLVEGESDASGALSALLETILGVSEATPMPDPDAARGRPFYSFTSLREYETQVFGFTAG